jgi:hypothetical protein
VSTFIAGLDLGQAQDYTAMNIIERPDAKVPTEYHCRYLNRWKLGTSYTVIVEDVARTLGQLPQVPARPYLILDATGVGRGIVDMFRVYPNLPAQLRAVTITAGEKASQEGADYRVPKQDLVGAMQVLIESTPKRLQLATKLPFKSILEGELMNFKAKVTAAAHTTYGAGPADTDWREGIHDDLVLCVALACWWGERGRQVNARAIGDGPAMGPTWKRVW